MSESLLGPNGQPISNPLMAQSQQSMKADVSINTQPAMDAFADLQKVLVNVTKSLSTGWEAATKDNLKAQENFYKYVGDKENERRVAVERLKKAAIASINEETAVQLAAIEQRARAEKTASATVNKEKQDLAADTKRKLDNVDRQAAINTKGPNIFGRGLEHVQNVAGRIGGPIGGLVSGAANIIADPEIAVPAAIIAALIEAQIQKSKNIKVGLQLAGAGAGQVGGGSFGAETTAQSLSDRIFGAIGISALGPSQRRDILSGMAQSHTLIDQTKTSAGATALTGNLGLFANILPDASKEMELFTDATKNLGMSQKDVQKMYFQTAKSSKDLNITHLDAIATQMDLQKALRNITNDGAVAANVLDSVGSFFHGIGKNEAETRRMTMGVANAGASMSLSQIAGMVAFTKGLGPTSGGMEQAIFGTNGKSGMLGAGGSGVFGLMGDFLTKVGGQAKNPMERNFMAEQLNKSLGLGIQTQDLPKLFILAQQLSSSGNKDKFAIDVEALSKKSKELSVTGMEDLKAIVDPIQKMAHWTEEFFNGLEKVLSKYFGAPKGSIHPNSQSLPTMNVKTSVNGGKHSSDFDVIQH